MRAGANVITSHRTSMGSPCAPQPAQITVRTVRRVVHTYKCMNIEIGDILVIVSILGVFSNARHMGASDSVTAPLVWGLLNAACAGLSVVGGLRRNPTMLVPYMITLVFDSLIAFVYLVQVLVSLLSRTKSIVADDDLHLGPSPHLTSWTVAAKLSLVIIINLIFFYVCHAARGVYKTERCRKECCVLPLPYLSPPISHPSKSSRPVSRDSAYETISNVSLQVPIRLRMDHPPSYRSRKGSGNSDKVAEKRKSQLAVVPISAKRRLPSLPLPSVTESHNQLYQNTWHGATVPAGRSPTHYNNVSVFNERAPRHSYPIARQQGYRHVSITESPNMLYANVPSPFF